MGKQIKIATPRKKSNIELLIDRIRSGNLYTNLEREETYHLCTSIGNAALLDADDIRKEARVAVVKLSAALETTTRLLAGAQKKLEDADQMFAEHYMKIPKRK